MHHSNHSLMSASRRGAIHSGLFDNENGVRASSHSSPGKSRTARAFRKSERRAWRRRIKDEIE
jgi:hypothetical protein